MSQVAEAHAALVPRLEDALEILQEAGVSSSESESENAPVPLPGKKAGQAQTTRGSVAKPTRKSRLAAKKSKKSWQQNAVELSGECKMSHRVFS